MKVRTLEHKRRVKLWVAFIITMTTWIGFGWWLDVQEYPAIADAGEWLDGVHFLPSLAIIMVYLSIIILFIQYYFRLVAWIIGKLIDKYY